MPLREEQWDRYNKALFRVKRSIRYHSHRQRYFERCHRIVMFVPLLLSPVIVFLLTAEVSQMTRAVGLSVLPLAGALCTASDAVIGFMQKAWTHHDFIRQFTDVQQRLLGMDWQDTEALTAVDQTIVEIEKLEPPIHRTLNLLCRNEELEAEGYPKSEWSEIGPVRRFFAQVSSR